MNQIVENSAFFGTVQKFQHIDTGVKAYRIQSSFPIGRDPDHPVISLSGQMGKTVWPLLQTVSCPFDPSPAALITIPRLMRNGSSMEMRNDI